MSQLCFNDTVVIDMLRKTDQGGHLHQCMYVCMPGYGNHLYIVLDLEVSAFTIISARFLCSICVAIAISSHSRDTIFKKKRQEKVHLKNDVC